MSLNVDMQWKRDQVELSLTYSVLITNIPTNIIKNKLNCI
jgi:hypothetical protein